MFTITNTLTDASVDTPGYVSTFKEAVEYGAAVAAAMIGNVAVRAAGDHRSFIVIRAGSDDVVGKFVVTAKPVGS